MPSTSVFTGGTIHTGRIDDRADWVLVQGDTIAAIGEGEPPSAHRTIDLDGGVLIPALRDAHVHLPATGLYEEGMDLRGVGAAGAILARFRERAASGEILFAGNFEEPLDRAITRADLDAAVGTRPALLARADLHSCIVSSALFERLDLDGVEGADRDAAGAPTGYLRERAAAEAWKWFDETLPPRQQRTALLRAVDLAYSRGVAETHEMFVVEWRGWSGVELLLDTLEAVALNVPVYLATDDVERVDEMGLGRIGGDWFLDGSFGSHTAWLEEPYVDPPPAGSSPTGTAYRSDAEVYSLFRGAQERGMQVGVHAIGDAAISQALRCWDRVASEVGVAAVRACGHRIEHFECARDDHVETAARLGLCASVQPAFDRFWGGGKGMYAARIGAERAATMNRFRTMSDKSLVIGGGSDSTVTPLDPFLQMAALRQHSAPEQSLDPAHALGVMTRGVASLAAREGKRGVIEVGARAEFALLDRDPLAVDVDELLQTEVLGTWVAGLRVWPKQQAEAA